MDIVASKILGALAAPAKWLYQFFVDQTRIEVCFASAEDWRWDSVPIRSNGTNTGTFIFSITTGSRQPVEITGVEVQYRAPLQLFDPGDRGFFVGAGTLEAEHPFCMRWSGSEEVRHDLQQAFALSARFPSQVEDQVIRIRVQARRMKSSLGGFIGYGRVRLTTVSRRIRLVSRPTRGLRVPAKSALTSAQPFLIESGMVASGQRGKGGRFIVHSRDADGSVSSVEGRLPDA